MEDVKFELLQLKDIVVSPTNPRKSFDLTKTTELAESIKEKGVLQPILVRAKGKKYEIVCGERRFRASQMVQTQDKKRDNIPAIIRELSDQEVREMQLIENFQREDVHPMEEALAIKYAVETGQYTIEDLKLKVGKSMTYMKQRMKLNDLTENWQKLFFNGNLTITAALSISQFPESVQELILEDRFDFEDLMEQPNKKVEVDAYIFNNYKGALDRALFDLTDATLNPKMGACTSCMFNTANAGLFPDEIEKARCNNIECFKTKRTIDFTRKIEAAKEDPSVVLISSQYSFDSSDKLVNDLIAKGEEVFSKNSFEVFEEPEKPEWEEYKEDNYDEDYNTLEEVEDDFKKAVADYEQDLADYTEKMQAGVLKKAFWVDGFDAGKFVYIHLYGKKQAVTAAAKGKVDIKDESVTVADVESEISRIAEKERRSKQIDENKIWDDLLKHFNPYGNANLLKGEFTPVERKAIAQTIYNSLSYHKKDEFSKLFEAGSKYEGVDFSNVDETMLRQMLRFFMLDKLPPAVLYSGYTKDAIVCLDVAKQYFPTVLQQIQDSHNEKIEKRVARIDARINELNSLKKELLKKEPKKEKTKKK